MVSIASLFGARARHVTGHPHRYVENRWPGFPSEEGQEGHPTVKQMPRNKNADQKVSAVATPNREKPKNNIIVPFKRKKRAKLRKHVWRIRGLNSTMRKEKSGSIW